MYNNTHDNNNYDKIPGIFGIRHSVYPHMVDIASSESNIRRIFNESSNEVNCTNFALKQRRLSRKKSIQFLINMVETAEEILYDVAEDRFADNVQGVEKSESEILSNIFKFLEKKIIVSEIKDLKQSTFFRKYINFLYAKAYFKFYHKIYGNSVTRRVWKELLEYFLNSLFLVKYLDGDDVECELEEGVEFNEEEPVFEINKSIRATFSFQKTMRTFIRLTDELSAKSDYNSGNFGWSTSVFGSTKPNTATIFSTLSSTVNKFNFKAFERSSDAIMYLNGRSENFGFYYRNTSEQLNQSWGNLGELYASNSFKDEMYFEVIYYKFIAEKNFEESEGLDSLYFRGDSVTNLDGFDSGFNLKANEYEDDEFPLFVNWARAGYLVIDDLGAFEWRTSQFYESNANYNVVFDSKVFGHPFHLVNPSILPIMFSFVFFTLVQDILSSFWLEMWYDSLLSAVGHVTMIGLFFSVILSWVLEIYAEEQAGFHTIEVQKGFQYAILLFILSEFMLFVSFFWAYFHFSLNSNSFTGGSYTPRGLVPFYSYRIPLLNTLLLLSSGLSLTVAHTLIVESDKVVKLGIWVDVLFNKFVSDWVNLWNGLAGGFLVFEEDSENYVAVISEAFVRRGEQLSSKLGLSKKRTLTVTKYNFDSKTCVMDNVGRISNDFQVNLPKSFLIKFNEGSRNTVWQPNYWILDTVLKGFVFLIFQSYEYTSCMFSMNDGVYGAVFFSLTGLHGIHVFLGVMFLFFGLLVNLSRNITKSYFKKTVEYDQHVNRYNSRGSFLKSSMNSKIWTHRIAFDGAAWYWHFVDVVWFFVFVFVYWWGFSA